MNFLAHLYLSGNDRDLILGNLIADAVRGRDLTRFGPGIARGILLHREIDAFTDNHPVVKRSKDRIRGKYGKYTGVVVDMYYDHFLAAGWNEYSADDLYDVTVKAYEVLLNNYFILPPKIKRILPFMMASNWLYSYRSLDMMERYFRGMSKRTSFYSGMEYAVDDLKTSYHLYKEEFEEFMPDLIGFVNRFDHAVPESRTTNRN